jgi:hypothetical protein
MKSQSSRIHYDQASGAAKIMTTSRSVLRSTRGSLPSPPLQNRTCTGHAHPAPQSPDPLARIALLTKSASAISVHSSDSRLIPPTRISPASLGFSTATCSPLIRDVRPLVSVSWALPPALASRAYPTSAVIRLAPALTSKQRRVRAFLRLVLRVRRVLLVFRGSRG